MKKNNKYKFILIFLILFLFAFVNNPSSARLLKTAALLRSEATIKIFSWQGRWEHKGAEETLKALGVNYEIISDDDLKKRDLNYSLIILPNIRCLSEVASENLRVYLKNGGRIFALYQSSYRNENNACVTPVNNFQLADAFDVDFYRWTNVPPKCEFLSFADVDKNLGGGNRIQLGRNTAMLVKPRKGAKILARFLDADGITPSETLDYSSAVVENEAGNCIYSSENLFAPENSASGEVKFLIASLLDKLSPGIVDMNFKTIKKKQLNYFSPRIPEVSPPSEGIDVNIGLGDFDEISVSSDFQLQVKGEGVRKNYPPGRLIYIEVISTLLKKPYMMAYSDDKMALAKFENEFEIENPGNRRVINVLKINPNGTYKIKSYRGRLKVILENDKIKLINILPLEEYVAGVLPNEMPQYFPGEALKSMGVINRTFVLSSLGRHKDEGFDVCSTVHCQVYGGLLSEEISTTNAVIETRGEAIFYGDDFAYTTFHSCCGGVVEDVEKVWPAHKPLPYLVSLADSPGFESFIFDSEEGFEKFIDTPPKCFCQQAGRFRWKETYSQDALEEILKGSLPVYFKDYKDFGKLVDVRVVDRSPHGRVQAMEILGTKFSYVVYKDSIRWLFNKGKLGLGGLQSTLFYIKKDDSGNYIFIGGGWGHGAGMCQEGAGGLAGAGRSYKEIIQHYYPGCEVKSGN